jgi:hypothetical protein
MAKLLLILALIVVALTPVSLTSSNSGGRPIGEPAKLVGVVQAGCCIGALTGFYCLACSQCKAISDDTVLCSFRPACENFPCCTTCTLA